MTQLTVLFVIHYKITRKLRETRRLGMFCRKRGIAGVRQCRQWRFFAEQSGKPIRVTRRQIPIRSDSATTADRIANVGRVG